MVSINKILVVWLDSTLLTSVQPKMIYASSKEALKRSLTGIAQEVQANDNGDLEYEVVLKAVSKGQAE